MSNWHTPPPGLDGSMAPPGGDGDMAIPQGLQRGAQQGNSWPQTRQAQPRRYPPQQIAAMRHANEGYAAPDAAYPPQDAYPVAGGRAPPQAYDDSGAPYAAPQVAPQNAPATAPGQGGWPQSTRGGTQPRQAGVPAPATAMRAPPAAGNRNVWSQGDEGWDGDSGWGAPAQQPSAAGARPGIAQPATGPAASVGGGWGATAPRQTMPAARANIKVPYGGAAAAAGRPGMQRPAADNGDDMSRGQFSRGGPAFGAQASRGPPQYQADMEAPAYGGAVNSRGPPAVSDGGRGGYNGSSRSGYGAGGGGSEDANGGWGGAGAVPREQRVQQPSGGYAQQPSGGYGGGARAAGDGWGGGNSRGPNSAGFDNAQKTRGFDDQAGGGGGGGGGRTGGWQGSRDGGYNGGDGGQRGERSSGGWQGSGDGGYNGGGGGQRAERSSGGWQAGGPAAAGGGWQAGGHGAGDGGDGAGQQRGFGRQRKGNDFGQQRGGRQENGFGASSGGGGGWQRNNQGGDNAGGGGRQYGGGYGGDNGYSGGQKSGWQNNSQNDGTGGQASGWQASRSAGGGGGGGYGDNQGSGWGRPRGGRDDNGGGNGGGYGGGGNRFGNDQRPQQELSPEDVGWVFHFQQTEEVDPFEFEAKQRKQLLQHVAGDENAPEPEKMHQKPDAYEGVKVDVSGPDGADWMEKPPKTFDEMHLPPQLLANIQRCNWAHPTPIQRHAVPIGQAGRDMIAVAQTGSGKTAAFAFPMICKLLSDPGYERKARGPVAKPGAIVMTPTRELCIQIFDEMRKFCDRMDLRPCPIYGGQRGYEQAQALTHGCDILVATPGRLLDFMNWDGTKRKRVDASACRFLVLDEADRMLDEGFSDDVYRLSHMEDLPDKERRQTFMFSATFPEEVQRLANMYLKEDYLFVTVGMTSTKRTAVDLIKQVVVQLKNRDERWDVVVGLLKELTGLTLIFANTRRDCADLRDHIRQSGVRADAIHGDLPQQTRERTVANFKNGSTRVLVSTDVMGRGMDITGVDHVINFDMPKCIEDYIHRIGRTGRAGRTGLATSFFNREAEKYATELCSLLRDTKNDVPNFLLEAAGQGGMAGNDYSWGTTATDYRANGGADKPSNPTPGDWATSNKTWGGSSQQTAQKTSSSWQQKSDSWQQKDNGGSSGGWGSSSNAAAQNRGANGASQADREKHGGSVAASHHSNAASETHSEPHDANADVAADNEAPQQADDQAGDDNWHGAHATVYGSSVPKPAAALQQTNDNAADNHSNGGWAGGAKRSSRAASVASELSAHDNADKTAADGGSGAQRQPPAAANGGREESGWGGEWDNSESKAAAMRKKPSSEAAASVHSGDGRNGDAKGGDAGAGERPADLNSSGWGNEAWGGDAGGW